jgi:pilus assembly protein CpaE
MADEKIRVIIVDDIAETRENIRKLLQFEGDVEVVGVARTGREGIDLAREVKPDVVLMDINMPDMDGIAATEAIRKLQPYIQIVILSVQSDPNYMRRAMLAGARDFLAKPPTVDELTSAIRRAGTMAHDERAKMSQVMSIQQTGSGLSSFIMGGGVNGHVVVVYSPKGGSGCTTLATNLAVALFNEETPVALVDGNLQFGDVAIFMKEQSKFSVVDLAPRVDELDRETIESVMMKHAESGLKILAAPHRPEYGESVTGEQFTKVLQALSQLYTYVVVDTSSALTDITIGAFDASDVIVLVTTQDIPAIKNAGLFLGLADVLDINRKRILFVMNRFDKRIAISPERVGENLKQEIVSVIPFDDRTVVPSVNKGVPVMISSKSSPVSRSILDLSEVVRKRIIDIESEDENPVVDRGRTKK